MDAGQHSTTFGQPIQCDSFQHLLLAGSSSWAWGRDAWRLHPALSRALSQPLEEPLPYTTRSCFARVVVGDSSVQGERGDRKSWDPSSDHTAEHNALGSIPDRRASCSTVNAGHGHHTATVMSEGSTEPYAVQCCVPTDPALSPTSSRFGHLEGTLASGRRR